MITTYDTRPLEKRITCRYKSVLPNCKNCGETLVFIPHMLFGVDVGGYWGHLNYCSHKHCPLSSDVTLRPNPITEASPA